ncbi:hypothetical protein BY458DRAFT_531438 [Sporodiniella umbellata]|nr:hypothetical protein BY458DRAFT_531438 [Sporodiniella umbellata]
MESVAVNQTDIIFTVGFDHIGNYLATSDKGGRVVLFERSESLIKWCERQNLAHFLLSTNLWKIHEKSIRVVSESTSTTTQHASQPVFQLPKMTHQDNLVADAPHIVDIKLANIEELTTLPAIFFFFLKSYRLFQTPIWDIHMDRGPIKTIGIHDHLKLKLCDLYENDCIFDKFESLFSVLALSSTIPIYFRKTMTGSYNNNIRIFNHVDQSKATLQTDKNMFRLKKTILHVSYYPRENIITIAATNNPFVFT